MAADKSQWMVYNPASGALVRSGQYVNETDVFSSIEKLHQEFMRWKKLTFIERQHYLLKRVEHIFLKKEALAEAIHLEMGKSLNQARAEVQKSYECARELCQMDLSFLHHYEVKSHNFEKAIIQYEPRGVILSVMPWNFPVWQVVRMVIPTLLTGNTILLKHSLNSPTVGDILARIFNSGLKEENTFELIQHKLFSHDVTESIIAHPKIQGASLTGSVKAGEKISQLCAQHFKKCVLELGGIDAALVLDDAELNLVAKKTAQSRLSNTGQVCISTKRVFVPEKNLEKLIEHLKVHFDTILNESNPDKTLVGPLAGSRFKDDYLKSLKHLNENHQKVYQREIEPKQTIVDVEHTAYVPAAIFVVQKPDDFVKCNEIFGPCLLVYPYQDLNQAIGEINNTPFGLGASIYGQDIADCLNYAQKIDVGQVAINDFVKTEVALPFGGVKKSGLGRELGREGFYEFLQTKTYAIAKVKV